MNKFWVIIEYPTRKKRIEYSSWSNTVLGVTDELQHRSTILDTNGVIHMLYSAMSMRIEIKQLMERTVEQRPLVGYDPEPLRSTRDPYSSQPVREASVRGVTYSSDYSLPSTAVYVTSMTGGGGGGSSSRQDSNTPSTQGQPIGVNSSAGGVLTMDTISSAFNSVLGLGGGTRG